MIDVLAVAITALAVTLVVDDDVVAGWATRSALGLWGVTAALMVWQHGLWPGLVHALAAFSVALAAAVLVAPLRAGVLRAIRVTAGVIAVVATIVLILGASGG